MSQITNKEEFENLKNIKNIMFDMGGVLVKLNRQASVKAYQDLGLTNAEELLDEYTQRGVFSLIETGEISVDEFCDEIRKEIGSEKFIANEQIKNAICVFLEGIPSKKLDLILEIKKKYTNILLTNTNFIVYDFIKENYYTRNGNTIDSYFDKKYASCELGCMKPDKKIFQLIIKDGFIPEETLFIDDAKANVDIANTLGFHTYLASLDAPCWTKLFGVE